GYKNIHFKIGSGYDGWIEHSPFDRIIITAAPPEIPINLVEQLKSGGKLILPVGEDEQQLQLIIKNEDNIEIKNIGKVKFVPMFSEE
ncbi:MAG: protein-L-isoaspartate O-methyltransferase family protein, partial [Thermodesulfobacteriota bacterium]